MPDDFDPLFGSPTGAAAAETALANNAGGAAAAAHTATVTTQPQAEPQAREPEDMFAQVMAQRDAGGAIPVVVVAEPLRDATAVPNAA